MYHGLKRCLAAWVLVGTVLLAGCGKTESTTLDEIPLPHVRVDAVVEVNPRPRSRHLVLVEPTRRTRLSPRVGGQVVEFMVEEQAQVKKGDALVRLAAQNSEGGVISAQASMSRVSEELRDTKRELRAVRKLVKQGIEPARSLERLQTRRATLSAQIREAKGGLVRAKDTLGASTLDAPFSGTVTSIDTELGEYLGPGNVALVLAQLDPLVAEVLLTEDELKLHDNGGLKFVLWLRGEQIEPKLEWVAHEAQSGTAMFPARLQIDNNKRRFRAGESAVAEVYGSQQAVTLAVPSTAIRWVSEQPYVYVVNDEHIQRVDIEIFEDYEDLVTIAGPLTAGAMVVAAGPASLTDGDQVVVVNSSADSLSETPG